MAAAVRIAVRRQVVDAEVHGTEADGLAVQRRLSGSVDGVVARALQEALDGLVSDEEHLVVDRLEIEADHVSLAGLDAALTDAVRRGATAFFRRHLPPPARPGHPAARTGSTADTARIVRRTPTATVAEAFAVFLATGRLPWSFRLPAGSDLEQVVSEAWTEAGRGDLPDAWRWQGVRRALAEPVARRRAVKQLSPAFVDDLVAHLAPSVAASLAEVHADGSSSPAWPAFGREVRLVALAAAAEQRSVTARELVRAARTALPPGLPGAPQLEAHLDRAWPQPAPGARRQAHRPPTQTLATASGEVAPDPRRGAGATPGPAQDGPSWLVDHAGLVLLHPFVPRFLEGLGLASGEHLPAPERAVAAVHLLATGQPVVPEHEATVAKLLCGWPLEDPVEREPDLTPTEVAEAEAVLAAAVGHWTALRNTSPRALRAEFLSRPGVLTAEGDDWVLRVEERSVDILLDQLPWGISLVRTPWMARLLRVEWRS